MNGVDNTRTQFDAEDRDEYYTYEMNGGKQATINFGGNGYGNLEFKANCSVVETGRAPTLQPDIFILR